MPADDVLREHYGRLTNGHPDDDAWEKLAMGELSAEDKAGVLDHASRCAQCARLLRGLHALEREALTVDPERARVLTGESHRATSRWWVGGILATAAALLIAVSVNVLSPRTSTDVTVRSSAPSRPEPLGPVGTLRQRPASFDFEPAVEGSRFSVELLDDAGAPIWKSRESMSTSLPWPRDIDTPPGRYYWRVFETDAVGDTTASPLAAFELTPE